MFVGGGDDPDVDLQRPGRADPGDLAIFDRAKKPVLGRAREGRQFVEEQGAAIRLLEPAWPSLGRTGERSGFVSEQLGFDQRLGQGGTVHDDQGAVPAGGQMVKPLGDQFLARPTLADHEHRAIERRGAACAFHRVEK